MKRPLTYLTFLVTILLFALSAEAHKVRIFAYSDNDQIIGETAFNGGRVPKNVPITVEDAKTGISLLTTTTDNQGKFSFPIAKINNDQQPDIRIIVDVGEGHRNEWFMKAAEYLPGKVISQPEAVPASTTLSPPEHESSITNIAVNEEILRQIVEESVANQLSPIKHILAANSEKRITLQDIISGLGYILGLAGIAAYMKSKQGGSA